MATKANSAKDCYGIGAVAKLTGLTDHTIRVWERRYGAVVAKRAPNGRREYSAADVEKLGLLKSLTDKGITISQIAGDDIAKLRERAQSYADITTVPAPLVIRTAVLGDTVPRQLAAYSLDLAPVDVLLAENSRDRFYADLGRYALDVIVLESPVLEHDIIVQLQDSMAQAGAASGVIIYSFGRVRDVDRARDVGLVALRAPVNPDEVRAAVIRARTQGAAGRPRPEIPSDAAADAAWEFAGSIAPRRFNQQQLANLAGASSSIDCECPQQLAQLVGDLSAFEIYSANCANRDADDAALHRYLHRTTAEARALVEVALERVARAEGLEF